jgi:hypothetical protein
MPPTGFLDAPLTGKKVQIVVPATPPVDEMFAARGNDEAGMPPASRHNRVRFSKERRYCVQGVA